MNKEGHQREERGEEDQTRSNAIKHKCCFLRHPQSVYTLLDLLRPVQIFQRNPRVAFVEVRVCKAVAGSKWKNEVRVLQYVTFCRIDGFVAVVLGIEEGV